MDQRFAEACVLAQERAFAAARRLKAANAELDAAEREHRLANEALDVAERLYYQKPAQETLMLHCPCWDSPRLNCEGRRDGSCRLKQETSPVCSGCKAPNTRGRLLASGLCTVCEVL